MTKLLIIASLLAAFGIIGSMDYEDELAQQEIYCDGVKDGTLPAYDNNIDCGE